MAFDNPAKFFKPEMPKSVGLFPQNGGSLVRGVPGYLEDIQPLSPKQNYSFVGVVPNVDAVNALKEAKLTRGGGVYEKRPVLFDANLIERYVDFIEEELKRSRVKNLSYPLVDGTRDYPMLTIAHPHIFLLPERKVETLDKILGQFNCGDVFAKMKEREAPQNYYLEPISLLHKRRILPLVRTPEVSGTFSGEQLKTLVDLLLHFRFEQHHDCGRTIDCD